MKEYGRVYWKLSHPSNMACLINKMVASTKIKTVFIMTNSGRDADRNALGLLVLRGSGADVVFLRDVVADRERDCSAPAWEREMHELSAELFLCAEASQLMSSGWR